MNDPGPAVVLDRLTRRYGAVAAVDDVTLEIDDGAFFTLLGPSGSGKTTCLRLVGGFDRPDAGRVLLHGQDVTGLPPYLRDVNTVFQDYALFPHMSVGENVAYGLMIRGVPAKERVRLAGVALDLVRLTGLSARRPSQLSGGQRQRVALARALVNRPRVLLLDEPLGALDQKLRQEMQGELKALQRQVGITFISVTHDQEEALSMSDRIAVFRRGRVEQVGSPADIYDRPASAFVAGFVGLTNLIPAGVAAALGAASASQTPGGDYVVRPEAIRLLGVEGSPATPEVAPAGWIALGARLDATTYLGASRKLSLTAVIAERSLPLIVIQPQDPAEGAAQVQPGDRVRLAWPRERMHPIPPAEPGTP